MAPLPLRPTVTTAWSPGGCRGARAAGEKAPGARPQRALGSLRLARGSPFLAGGSRGTGRGAAPPAAGRGGGLAPLRAPRGCPGRTSKPPRARKFTQEQAQGEHGGAQVPSRERFGLGSTPFSPLAFSVPTLFVHLILERGTFQAEASRVAHGPLRRAQVGRLPAAPGPGEEGRASA